MFENIAGSMTGALLPTGNAVDVIDGVEVHADRQRHALRDPARRRPRRSPGRRRREALEADAALKARLEAIRLQAGPLMNLGDVAAKSVPKMTLVSAPGRRRRDRHPQLHPAPRPRLDRRPRRRHRRHRLPAAGQPRRRAGAHPPQDGRFLDRAPDRRGGGLPRPRPRRHASRAPAPSAPPASSSTAGSSPGLPADGAGRPAHHADAPPDESRHLKKA